MTGVACEGAGCLWWWRCVEGSSGGTVACEGASGKGSGGGTQLYNGAGNLLMWVGMHGLGVREKAG